ncbi:multidrug efflux MFS transporter [Enterococcus asini]|uniref:Major facilitator superfamily transporter multidrug:cation transporter n=2 Tax=Enterococcus asini TaxID=57732 RepID=R2SMM5_9ENTE|nr:multidrug efflux MFS transporter [Enterococcus asini]EOH89469.1 major facilitator superfamily transporter multidrug:cation transporter [Enterococcus asini ATCC 700915]EOT56512.1 major facilitator superfamily transporter multidrug:cation transporter [Enterococcus asini ATCC 700915]MCD5030196.1 multidrug efflux MFS transporter [Enterococcus asini]MDT2745139.1 multidrug efflux MFS transporter [Enterococcus asini]MDT2785356.1 multidrug efflux MFS transporter [Enterococcus asini]
MKIDWRRNLLISWVGCFFTGASFSLVMPFIPLYIEQLGTPKSQIELFSGLAISVTALASAIVAPIWGNLADRKGRRLMMIRAAVGMTFTMGSLAFVPNVYWLLLMRFMTGILSGYIPNATALIASQAPREKSGWALGTLATGAIAGNLIGPSMGGALAQWFGMENVFIITGVVLLITTILTIVLVKEDFTPIKKTEMAPIKDIFAQMENFQILIGLFVTSLILQIGITSISPILTLYIRDLSGNSSNVLFVSGLIVSVSGVSAILSSPSLGKIGDRIGNHKVLLFGLVLSLVCFVPMGFVKTPFQLGVLRFLLGFSTGALTPSINTLINKITPAAGVSRVYSYNQMFQNFGQVLGPMVGSTVAHSMGYPAVFWVTSGFVLINIGISLFNFRKNLRNPI